MTVDADSLGRYQNSLDFLSANGVTTGYAGVISATINGVDNYDVFCVDLYNAISPGTTYQVTTLSSSDPQVAAFSLNTPRAAWLYVNYLSVVSSSADPDVESAALQLAIWDVIHDGGDGLSAGTIQADPAMSSDATTQTVYSDATAFINGSAGQSAMGAVFMNVLGPTGSQTLLTDPLALQNEVPEASTMAMFGMGFAALAGWARRRRAANQAGA
jgi:hypothetical protein